MTRFASQRERRFFRLVRRKIERIGQISATKVAAKTRGMENEVRLVESVLNDQIGRLKRFSTRCTTFGEDTRGDRKKIFLDFRETRRAEFFVFQRKNFGASERLFASIAAETQRMKDFLSEMQRNVVDRFQPEETNRCQTKETTLAEDAFFSVDFSSIIEFPRQRTLTV